MKVQEALTFFRQVLGSIENSRLEVDRLISTALGCTTSELLMRERDELMRDQIQWMEACVSRRVKGEPLAYILEKQGFYKYEFYVRPGVLIPRPETEMVVEEALKLFPKPPLRFADFGCGSGCIGLSLLKQWPVARLWAIDESATAIGVTKENSKRLKVLGRCEVVHGSIESSKKRSEFDLIVANPPYIADNDPQVEMNVKKYEPREALFAGKDGLNSILSWSEFAYVALKPGGWWITEIGTGQSKAVVDHLDDLGFQRIVTKKDYAGHDRVVFAQATKR